MSPRCSGTTKTGKPCGAHPLKGRDVCLSHADEKERVSMGFGVNGGRPRVPRKIDAVRERMEAEIDAWLAVLEDARGAMRAVVVGQGEHATVEYVPDHAIRLAAFREAMDRSYGKPRQATGMTGADGGLIQVVAEARAKAEAMSREELDAFLMGC